MFLSLKIGRLGSRSDAQNSSPSLARPPNGDVGAAGTANIGSVTSLQPAVTMSNVVDIIFDAQTLAKKASLLRNNE